MESAQPNVPTRIQDFLKDIHTQQQTTNRNEMTAARTRAAITAIAMLLVATAATAQSRTVAGRVVDAKTGENVAFANVAETGTGRGTTTNSYGYFSLRTDGKFSVSCMGYEPLTLDATAFAQSDSAVEIRLNRKEVQLDEVQVSATVPEVEMVQMSKNTVPIKLVRAMPSFTGEPDIIKAITFLPGVSAGNDGMSDIFVRGGDRGQNLITLDGMKIYNVSHMFGLVSLFNSDMVKNVDVYKGIFPARYGGRLASVIDVTSRDGDDSTRTYHISVGMLSSTAFAQGPIIPGKLTFAVAARAGYSDLFNIPSRRAFYNLDFQSKETYNSMNSSYVSQSFYDINARLRWKISSTAHLTASTIIGTDFEHFGEAFLSSNNKYLEKSTGRTAIRNNGVSLTFVKSFDNIFWRTSAAFTSYRNNLRSKTESTDADDRTRTKTYSGTNTNNSLKEISIKSGIEQTHAIGKLYAGAEVSRYLFSPLSNTQWQEAAGVRTDSVVTAKTNMRSVESSLYADEELNLTSSFSLDLGLRATAYHASAAYGEADTTFYRLEPRASLRLLFSRHLSLKAGFSVANQFNHCVLSYVDDSQSEAWMAATRRTLPQHAKQAALGLFYANDDAKINISAEGYYKWMTDLQYYRSTKVVSKGSLLNSIGQDILTGGDGRAYGFEFMGSKDLPHGVSASVSYTWQRSERKFDGINYGTWFPHLFERRHSLTLLGLWDINKNWSASATFNFSTGKPFTMPTSFVRGDMVDPAGHFVFTEVNNQRMPNYHRLDLNVSRNYTGKRGTKMLWALNIYNVYAHKNPSYVNFSASSNKVKVYSDYTILPSLSWSIWF